MEEAFTEAEMRLAGIYCRALIGSPTDFDRGSAGAPGPVGEEADGSKVIPA